MRGQLIYRGLRRHMETHRLDDTAQQRGVGRGQSQGEEQLLLQFPLFLKSKCMPNNCSRFLSHT